MAHRRQEVALRPGCRLRRVPCHAQFLRLNRERTLGTHRHLLRLLRVFSEIERRELLRPHR